MKIAIVAALVSAYLQLGWLGVAAGLTGCALVWVFVLIYALRYDETDLEIER
ncbi:hypothetical protein OM076_00620 [Solirubrobacter ginsenosidimutans]|uniref:Uncharacterized protein n=1 Tax=Solirubrobacter ginsenosidimutans TaxID=490573 RepID=A0A9X3MPB3_9ACTN|nr:hypothetical protein [Solirubrobacter ginsenosidimutans]MDA0158750.1 hypothetical protein [Solirubrobacter ginsenosidimutans]